METLWNLNKIGNRVGYRSLSQSCGVSRSSLFVMSGARRPKAITHMPIGMYSNYGANSAVKRRVWDMLQYDYASIQLSLYN